MKKINSSNIKKFIKDSSHVKLFYFEDEYYGQILLQSKKFVLIREIKDWHYDAYIIFPKIFISKIKYGKLEKFREKLMESKASNEVGWLDISSFKSILKTLRDNFNQVCIEGAAEEVNQFVLGTIESFDRNNLFLRKLSPVAKLSTKETVIPKKEITAIYFGDEYSTRLFSYARK